MSSETTLKQRFVEMKAEVGAITKDLENKHMKYRYANIAQIFERIQPLQMKHKLLIKRDFEEVTTTTTITLDKETGDVVSKESGGKTLYCITRIISTLSDEEIMYTHTFPLDGQAVRGATAIQQAGAILTYVQRYTLCDILDIPNMEDADEQRQAPPTKAKEDVASRRINTHEVQELLNQYKKIGIKSEAKVKERLYEAYGINELNELPLNIYQGIIRGIANELRKTTSSKAKDTEKATEPPKTKEAEQVSGEEGTDE